MYANKKCPFTNTDTLGFGRTYTECNKSDCRFQVEQRCAILEQHAAQGRLEQKIDKLAKALNLKL